ncbi:hypothetical protein [Staphylococcus chromogenes]|uniref:hypothetical protein n=1 Tax=Staphylococcus chromogenes TaxID=46126 RepID=UPI002DB5C3C2|nr:hypothetical protein [Staphylococcus chromogenes]MEB7824690.1 hypothetical protein [Staphylococcus chromogenes]
MINEVFNAFEDVALAGMKASQLRGESDRLSELIGYLIEKAKAYREEGDIKGAEAIELVVLDDLKLEFDSVCGEFREEMKKWKQKTKKLKNVCAMYGVNILLGKDDNIVKFQKGDNA